MGLLLSDHNASQITTLTEGVNVECATENVSRNSSSRCATLSSDYNLILVFGIWAQRGNAVLDSSPGGPRKIHWPKIKEVRKYIVAGSMKVPEYELIKLRTIKDNANKLLQETGWNEP